MKIKITKTVAGNWVAMLKLDASWTRISLNEATARTEGAAPVIDLENVKLWIV